MTGVEAIMEGMTQLESLLGATFERVKFEDLQRLVANAVPEGDQLDFKRDLYVKREEFAADVVAFANTSGGPLSSALRKRRESLRPSRQSSCRTRRISGCNSG